MTTQSALRIEQAMKRLFSLISTGYLPEPLREDIEVLMNAAQAWIIFCNKEED